MDEMTLAGYYKNLPPPVHPKTAFVKQVAEKCGVGLETVRTWIRGDAKPGDDRYYEILSNETGIPKEKLFPDENA